MKLDSVSELYANMMQVFSIGGMVLLLLSFSFYIAGVPRTDVSPERVVELWHLDAESFSEATGTDAGWRWVSRLPSGDTLAFASLVFLALATIGVMIALVPAYVKSGDPRFAAIAGLEALVLALAASGLLVIT